MLIFPTKGIIRSGNEANSAYNASMHLAKSRTHQSEFIYTGSRIEPPTSSCQIGGSGVV